ncbi:hypothetical protein B0T09DRAFT_393440, partial [Sordaria sp. MPI-SDFR-AT-0083]
MDANQYSGYLYHTSGSSSSQSQDNLNMSQGHLHLVDDDVDMIAFDDPEEIPFDELFVANNHPIQPHSPGNDEEKLRGWRKQIVEAIKDFSDVVNKNREINTLNDQGEVAKTVAHAYIQVPATNRLAAAPKAEMKGKHDNIVCNGDRGQILKEATKTKGKKAKTRKAAEKKTAGMGAAGPEAASKEDASEEAASKEAARTEPTGH